MTEERQQAFEAVTDGHREACEWIEQRFVPHGGRDVCGVKGEEKVVSPSLVMAKCEIFSGKCVIIILILLRKAALNSNVESIHFPPNCALKKNLDSNQRQKFLFCATEERSNDADLVSESGDVNILNQTVTVLNGVGKH